MPRSRFIPPRRFVPVAGAVTLLLLAACDDAMRGMRRAVRGESPHARYADRLRAAGLDRAAVGARWIAAGDSALAGAAVVTPPMREAGYFAPTDVRAVAYRFPVRRGQRAQVIVASEAGATSHDMFADLYRLDSDGRRERLRSMGGAGGTLVHEMREDGELLVRLQPELLRGVRYTLVVRLAPSLDFPVAGRTASAIRSYWGAARDGGRRSHQGVDIFAPRGTPVLAAAPGIVTSVGENRLGGRVVWVWDAERDVAHYYAHLDVQLAERGQRVRSGDTLGRVGNTGNARTTPPHLHFGLYRARRGGAVDPLPYLAAPPGGEPAPVSAPLEILGEARRVRNGSRAGGVVPNAAGTVVAARGGRYVLRLADGATVELAPSALEELRPVPGTMVARGAAVHERPDSAAIRIARLAPDAQPVVLGRASGGWCLVERTDAAPRGWAACRASGG